MFRVHRNYMSQSMSTKLLKEIHSHHSWDDSEHLWFKKERRSITDEEVDDAVEHGDVVEYNELKGTRRVLLKNTNGICVVVDLDTKQIITAFKDSGKNSRGFNSAKYLFMGS